MYVYICIYMYLNIYINILVSIYIHTHTYTHTHTHIHRADVQNALAGLIGCSSAGARGMGVQTTSSDAARNRLAAEIEEQITQQVLRERTRHSHVLSSSFSSSLVRSCFRSLSIFSFFSFCTPTTLSDNAQNRC